MIRGTYQFGPNASSEQAIRFPLLARKMRGMARWEGTAPEFEAQDRSCFVFLGKLSTPVGSLRGHREEKEKEKGGRESRATCTRMQALRFLSFPFRRLYRAIYRARIGLRLAGLRIISSTLSFRG